jgi:hypothetical protein
MLSLGRGLVLFLYLTLRSQAQRRITWILLGDPRWEVCEKGDEKGEGGRRFLQRQERCVGITTILM